MIKITHKKRYENVKKSYQEIKYEIPIIESDDYGIVIETTYNDASILHNNEIKVLKLSSKIKGPHNKLLFAGDKVVVKNNNIIGILARKNILSRSKIDSTKLNDSSTNRIVATNIDLAVIVVSKSNPPLHPKLIDRYIILLENAKIPYILVLNKADLLTEQDDKILKTYKNNIKIIKTSIITLLGIDDLKKQINNKQVIFLGHSGVGKSSLTKLITNQEDIKIGNLRKKNNKGCHTTTTSTYYKWNSNSSIIDTPGIRNLAISSYPKEEIANYFKEFAEYKDKCKYKNCYHYREKISDCAVKQAVTNKKISKERYESYYKIIESLDK